MEQLQDSGLMYIAFETDFTQVADLMNYDAKWRVKRAIAMGVQAGLATFEQTHKTKWFIWGHQHDPKTHPTKITNRTAILVRSYMSFYKKGAHKGHYGTTLLRARLLELGGTATIKPGFPARPTVGKTTEEVGPKIELDIADRIFKALESANQ